MRLIDRLDDTMIQAGGFPSVSNSGELFMLDFENADEFKPIRALNPTNPWRIAKGALRYDKLKKISPLEWHVTVPANQLINVTCRARTKGLVPGPNGIGATLEIDELDSKEKPIGGHKYLKNIVGTTDWTDIQTQFRSRSKTAAILVRLMAGTPAQAGTAFFDDVTVSTVSDLADLAASPPVVIFPGNKAAHSMVRRVSLNQDSRPTVVTRVGTKISFKHGAPVPAEFHYGVGRPRFSKAEVCFRVRRGMKVLDERCVSGPGWTDVTIPVDTAEPLLLETYAVGKEDETAVGLWANPRVVPLGKSPSPPIVIVVVDTLRADRLGAYGAPPNASPAMDEFAKKSIVFENAFSTSSWTAPSLASMISSRWPTEHCAGSRIPLESGRRLPKDDKELSNKLEYRSIVSGLTALPDMMKASGYETVGFNCNYFFSEAVGFDKPYDKYESFRGNTDAGGEMGLDNVRAFLDGRRNNAAPFFMVFHIVDPHMPYRWRKEIAEEGWPPPSDLSKVVWNNARDIAKLDKFDAENMRRMADVKKFYDAETQWSDHVMKAFFEILLPYDPVIVFMSDHGEAFKEHGKIIHGNSMYNELVHVPLLLRLPGDERAGTRLQDPVSLVDIAPTLLSLTKRDLPSPVEWRGRSLLEEGGARDLFLEGMYSGQDMSAIIRWPFKLIWNHPEREVGFASVHPYAGGFELYNLQDDPKEKRNLAEVLPEKTAELSAPLKLLLLDSLHGTHVQCRTGDKPMTVSFTASKPIAQLLSMTLEDGDNATLSPDKQTLTLNLEATNDEDWIVLRASADDLTLTSSGPVDRLPRAPASVPEGRCAVWSIVCGGNAGMSMSESELEGLRALGYIE